VSVSDSIAGDLSAADRAAYDVYRRVRDEVLRWRSERRGTGAAAPSQYWADELTNIDYMVDATPLIVRKLRHHAVHITGIRPYDYREYGDKQVHFERRLRALEALAGGSDLLVGEPEALGGFGYRIDGRLHNVDTLKFFEVFAGMRRAGLLDTVADGRERPQVVEIGGGWGGFAYQFKTLFPNTTYVIVDLPELFLFSATYLATLFPAADIRFVHDERTPLDGWESADFVFVPNDRAAALRQFRPDLLVNLVSFQEMTTAQVEAYAELAASAGCRSLYSLNRDRSHYNSEVESVSRILARHYQLREVRLLGSDYTKAIKKDSAVSVDAAAKAGRLDESRYRHLVGTLRHADTAPRVGIGLTLHNRAAYLREAVDSLLIQTHADFRLVLVDDGSTDETEAIARAYAAQDPRVRYVRNDQRVGMVEAWRQAFALATAEPHPEYFAWASDHDRWHPDWLRSLVDTLDLHPEVVIAYPFTQRIDAEGRPLPKGAREFETFGITDREVRWRRFSLSEDVAAGDMVYGLMRTAAVESAGVFRPVLCPDRLLMAELTLRGEIRQVPEVLWYRRQFSVSSIARQRQTLFTPGARPLSRFATAWSMHARSIWNTYRGPARDALGLSRAAVVRMVVENAGAYAFRHYMKSEVQRGIMTMLGWPRWMYKRVKHAALLIIYYVLVTGRRLLHLGPPSV
jgi:putative sugar O-methyltransferase